MWFIFVVFALGILPCPLQSAASVLPMEGRTISVPPQLKKETNGLYYKGSEGRVYGPFAITQMQAWWTDGYFPPGELSDQNAE